MNTPKSVNPNIAQFYLANQVVMLPRVYEEFLADLVRLSLQQRLCLTPCAILDAYNIQIRQKISMKIDKALKRVA